jgi:hypothetical protein
MKLIPTGLTRTIGRMVIQSKKNAPTIYFVGGVIGAVGSTVLACKATLKVEEVLDGHEERAAKVRVMQRTGDIDEYSRSMGNEYARTAGYLVRLYGPSILLGGVSIAALTGSHKMLQTRNKELGVAVVAVTKAYQEYRARVQNEIGAEREAQIYRGYTGTKKDGKLSSDAQMVNPTSLNPYRFVFDRACPDFIDGSPDMNRLFLQAQQEFWQHKLRSRGHVFLNEVLTSLGIDHTPEGALAGWKWNGEGDDFIDFGLYTCEENIPVWNGESDTIFLDFNVDGSIWDKL